jgi:hypothetical protein
MIGRLAIAPRTHTSWLTFGPNEPARCPACHTRLGDVGADFQMMIRPNPKGSKQPPTQGVPYSEHCRRCDVNLERVTIPYPPAA